MSLSVQELETLSQLGLTEAEVARYPDLFGEAAFFAGQGKIQSDSHVRRYVSMRRKGETPAKALWQIEHGSGCLGVILGVGIILALAALA